MKETDAIVKFAKAIIYAVVGVVIFTIYVFHSDSGGVAVDRQGNPNGLMASLRKSAQGDRFNEEQGSVIRRTIAIKKRELAEKVVDLNGVKNLRRKYYGNMKSNEPDDLRSEADIMDGEKGLRLEIKSYLELINDLEVRLAALEASTQ